MSDDMKIADYLAQGGVLTSPGNVPPRYRAELMRLMASFVDSELAGAAGFADIINQGPGVKERIAAAKIVMEKTDHADQILTLMGQFGTNTDRYANYHPWTERLDRDAPIGTNRTNSDMRLAVFNYPLNGWTDAVAMNMLMGKAVGVQLSEYAMISYQPLAEAVRKIMPRETRHTELAEEGMAKLVQDRTQKAALKESVAYWWPRVESSFGSDASNRFEPLQKMGLRKLTNKELRDKWRAEASTVLAGLDLPVPD
ncbi:Phenylacetic acid catabolic protein [uncultured Sulfitobacter sp.]|jgi:ring-1,2-phenylacetyl-CoA epoxidase subunit PaaA|uniref:Phenylacetic acid catabolic protein n=1 Tax=uncultured Sulfitobacter sp. TaxID=191468 RepID=UPI0030FA172E